MIKVFLKIFKGRLALKEQEENNNKQHRHVEAIMRAKPHTWNTKV